MPEHFDINHLQGLFDKHIDADLFREFSSQELYALTVEIMSSRSTIARSTKIGFISIDALPKRAWTDEVRPEFTPSLFFHFPLQDPLTGGAETIRGLNADGHLTARIPNTPGLVLVDGIEKALFCNVVSFGIEDMAQQLV